MWGGSEASELRERLLEAGSSEAMFGVLECALLNRLQRPLLAHPAVAYALRQLAAADGVMARNVLWSCFATQWV